MDAAQKAKKTKKQRKNTTQMHLISASYFQIALKQVYNILYHHQ